MKVNFHYHFYSRIFISLLIFACGFFLWQKSVDTRALVDNVYKNNTPITGWAWNDQMGWIALSCENDFDGDGVLEGDYDDGTGLCSGTKWGLTMTIDSDNLKYIKGCAWAGGIAESSVDEASPGWICFSDTVDNATDAPTKGVLMSNEEVDINYCQCKVTPGICDGPVKNNRCVGTAPNKHCSMDLVTCVNNRCGNTSNTCISNSDCYVSCNVDDDCAPKNVESCTSYTYCSGSDHILWSGNTCGSVTNACRDISGVMRCSETGENCVNNDDCPAVKECLKSRDSCTTNADCPTWTNACVNNFCYTSGESCSADSDCQYACRNDANTNFLIKGVCFDNSSEQEDILDMYRGDKPPFSRITGADGTMTSCYINNDCVSGSECVYPQVGLVDAVGKGYCKNMLTGVEQEPPTACAYYFDCDTGYSCAISMPDDLVDVPDSCDTSICTEGYEQEEVTVVGLQYQNALNPYALDDEGYASILKMESISSLVGYSRANRLGFPIGGQISRNPTDSNYDPDDPNIGQNPLRGCFNCYSEKKYACVSGLGGCVCDQSENSCEYSQCGGEAGVDNCAVVEFEPAVCENCQEYFYYTEDKKTCSIRTDFDCSMNTCPSGFGVCTDHKEGDLEKVLTGFNCTDCTIDNPANSCTMNAQNTNNNRCNSCETELTPGYPESTVYSMGGVLYDNQHGAASVGNLCGWGYNQWSKTTGLGGFGGFGWFNFSPRISTSTKPYFSVEQGNIYSKAKISTLYQPPINKYNASYLIEAGGDIRNFVSGASRALISSISTSTFQGELANRPIINFLSLSFGKYTNALGKLDYQGLITVANSSGGVYKNKYGSVIDEINSNFDSPFDTAFNNKIYLIKQDVTLGSTELLVKKGTMISGVVESGAGIIIVEGNLTINENIRYQAVDGVGGITNLKQIPSLVWIVKGDVAIDPSVEEVVGTFIVLGDGVNSCTDADPSRCGQFKSGSTNQNALKVRGNILARKFILERTYVDSATGDPAEQFINDGRLQSNPPLGLKDMSGVIPRFSSY